MNKKYCIQKYVSSKMKLFLASDIWFKNKQKSTYTLATQCNQLASPGNL